MGFVQNHMLERDLFQDFEVVDKELIVDKQNLKFGYFWWNNITIFGSMKMEKFIILDDFSGGRGSFVIVKQTVELRPLLNLSSPLRQRCQRRQYQERTQYVLVSMKMVKEWYGLDCFSETHLISQYAISVFVPVFYHPIQALELEFFEHSVVLENGNILSAILSWLLSQPVK